MNKPSENESEEIHPHKPRFLITVDTEGDNLWSRPEKLTTKNAGFLQRFQALCESYALKPSYLTNYEMANSPIFKEFGLDVLERDNGEIGMHLHAWDTPPLTPLTKDDHRHHPYLIEYPEERIREKITLMTELLESTFGTKIISHRAGRWSFNGIYASILVELGYRVDCSVTPHFSWKREMGDPDQHGGTDYSNFPEEPYFLDLDDISRSGNSPLLELPVTIMKNKRPLIDSLVKPFNPDSIVYRALYHFLPSTFWLRPNGKNLRHLLDIVRQAVEEKRSHVEFIIHSSELMPGGSPIFHTESDIEGLYRDLERLFQKASTMCVGATLKEYHQLHLAGLE